VAGDAGVKSAKQGPRVEVRFPPSAPAVLSTSIPIPGVLVLEPGVFSDDQGFFLGSYNKKALTEVGVQDEFVQDNHSFPAAMSCADWTIRLAARRRNWFAR